jgi:3-oxoacyl-[acyl-carrier protein] reductase
MRLKDKVALIAGAGGRQGTAVPIVFAREGARLVLCGLDGVELERLAARIIDAGGQAVSRGADLTAEGEADAAAQLALDTFGCIDILYNNTGMYAAGETRADATSTTDWEKLLRVNAQTHFLTARAVLPAMLRRRSGCIINVAAARAARLGGNVAYGASKAAVIGLTKKLAREYAEDNIRVNCICPTNIQESPSQFDAPPPQLLIDRDGTPEDIAYAALFLASDEAAWITGAELVVDGGAEARG